MPAFPYMRFFVGDYLGDTRHLSTLEHGAYLLLIMAYWQRGKPLPNRDAELARIAGVSRPQWVKMRPTIEEFFDVSGGEFLHHRIEQEIHHSLDKSLKSKRAGEASVKRRRNKRLTKPDAIDQNHNLSDASHPTDIPPTPQGGERDLFDGEPPDGGNATGEKYPAAFEQFWSAYPNKTGKRKAAAAYVAAAKRIGGAGVHDFLLASVAAQIAVWRAKGIEGRFIPHPTTWLNQGRYDDPAVAKRRDAPVDRPAMPEPELSPPTPAPQRDRPLALHPVGWKPDDEG